mmetsp:Transcript_32848/g.70445  ORF Transcript_32848/g.70445 Transcript_32848/m.70445 type:complete len:207 (+) Transcript_32848:1235-1855(+)
MLATKRSVTRALRRERSKGGGSRLQAARKAEDTSGNGWRSCGVSRTASAKRGRSLRPALDPNFNRALFQSRSSDFASVPGFSVSKAASNPSAKDSGPLFSTFGWKNIKLDVITIKKEWRLHNISSLHNLFEPKFSPSGSFTSMVSMQSSKREGDFALAAGELPVFLALSRASSSLLETAFRSSSPRAAARRRVDSVTSVRVRRTTL